MLRNVLSVIAGYAAMFVFVFVTFTVAYLILGAEGSFQPGTYEVSGAWALLSIVLGLAAAILGGWVCMAIARNSKVAMVLAAVVLVLGILMAIPAFSEGGDDRPLVRGGDVGNMEAMQYARQPVWLLLLNPLLGAFGVILGSRMYKGNKAPSTPGVAAA
jgi:hypothetical protein